MNQNSNLDNEILLNVRCYVLECKANKKKKQYEVKMNDF